jgi:hypothetical protein
MSRTHAGHTSVGKSGIGPSMMRATDESRARRRVGFRDARRICARSISRVANAVSPLAADGRTGQLV